MAERSDRDDVGKSGLNRLSETAGNQRGARTVSGPGAHQASDQSRTGVSTAGYSSPHEMVQSLLDGNERERARAAHYLTEPVTVPGTSSLLAVLKIRRGLLASSRERLDRLIRKLSNELAKTVVLELTHATGVDARLLLSCARILQSPEVVPALRACLQSPDRLVAVLALDVAAGTGGPESAALLVEALAVHDLRWDAISLIRQIGDQQALSAAARYIQDPDPLVRREAVCALAQVNDQRIVPYLERMADSDESVDVRNAAVAGLVAVGRKLGRQVDENALNVKAAGAVRKRFAIDSLLTEARLRGASDVHLIPGLPAAFRIHGALVDVGKVLSAQQIESVLNEIIPEHLAERYREFLDADFSYVVEGMGRHRVNVFCERRGMASVIRLIASSSPCLDELGLPSRVRDVVYMQQGLVLVTGKSGTGKSSTMAALVREISEKTPRHILTLEDPVEYLHPSTVGLVNQREVGKHTKSFSAALRSALREDPDVIVIGEMRDIETMRMVLEASETGHLVIATMHTPDTVGAIQRLIESFPAQEQSQIRISVADSLRMILAQTLVPRVSGEGRIAAVELMVVNSAISTLIRENKINQIKAAVQLGRLEGMQTMDNALMKLLEAGRISIDEAVSRAIDKDAFRAWVEREKA